MSDREAPTHFERAALLRQNGDHAGALSAYLLALSLQPDHTDALEGAAASYAALGIWTRAVESYMRLSTLRPDITRSLLARADCLRRAGCYLAAIERYDAMLSVQLSVDALAGRGEALRLLGAHGEALDWFERALRHRSDHVAALRGRAASLNALGRFDES